MEIVAFVTVLLNSPLMETMQASPPKINPRFPVSKRGGFALPVVLGGLLLVTALFATAQLRSLGHISQVEAEQALLVNLSERQEMLDLARIALGSEPITGPVALADGSGRMLVLQDVGGLIDLNSAHPDLLANLCASLLPGTDCENQLRSWRQTGRRLHSVQDFARVVGLPASEVDRLPAVTTVFSGRFGIDPTSAPDDVLEIAGSESGTVPQALSDQPTSNTFAVWLARSDGSRLRFLGTIQNAAGTFGGRILEQW